MYEVLINVPIASDTSKQLTYIVSIIPDDGAVFSQVRQIPSESRYIDLALAISSGIMLSVMGSEEGTNRLAGATCE